MTACEMSLHLEAAKREACEAVLAGQAHPSEQKLVHDNAGSLLARIEIVMAHDPLQDDPDMDELERVPVAFVHLSSAAVRVLTLPWSKSI